MIRPIGFSSIEHEFHRAFKQGTLHHAWLFHGLSGIGKAMLAQSLATDCLCLDPNDVGQACGRCNACNMLAKQSHPDFLRVSKQWDEKKKRFKRDINIAQVRELLSFLSLSSLDGHYHVVLLDGVENLNMQAANALLKGLEEPSFNSLLLLVSHDLQRLVPTLRSRCLLQACPPLCSAECAQVVQTMSLDEQMLPLAEAWMGGRPGSMQLLQEKKTSGACLTLHTLTQRLGKCGIGELHDCLQACVHQVPHSLLAKIIYVALRDQLLTTIKPWQDQQRLLDAIQQILCWPGDVHRHTLRPIPALLSRMMVLRACLRKHG